MDPLYLKTLQELEMALNVFGSYVPQPQRVPFRGSFVFRYVEKTVQQAIIQKLARIISGLYAAQILLETGFVQELGAIQRMLDEFREDVVFLCYAVIKNDIKELHNEYLENFYQEELDPEEDSAAFSKSRPMVKRQKIRAEIARFEESELDRSRGVDLYKTISKVYSGYVHGASSHIMEMYGENPNRFHVAGMRGTPIHDMHKYDLWNYFYRAICTFGIAAKTFGDEKLFSKIQSNRDNFERQSSRQA